MAVRPGLVATSTLGRRPDSHRRRVGAGDDYETFARDRLMPAMQTVVEQHDISLDGPQPETSITEVANIIRG